MFLFGKLVYFLTLCILRPQESSPGKQPYKGTILIARWQVCMEMSSCTVSTCPKQIPRMSTNVWFSYAIARRISILLLRVASLMNLTNTEGCDSSHRSSEAGKTSLCFVGVVIEAGDRLWALAMTCILLRALVSCIFTLWRLIECGHHLYTFPCPVKSVLKTQASF